MFLKVFTKTQGFFFFIKTKSLEVRSHRRPKKPKRKLCFKEGKEKERKRRNKRKRNPKHALILLPWQHPPWRRRMGTVVTSVFISHRQINPESPFNSKVTQTDGFDQLLLYQLLDHSSFSLPSLPPNSPSLRNPRTHFVSLQAPIHD